MKKSEVIKELLYDLYKLALYVNENEKEGLKKAIEHLEYNLKDEKTHDRKREQAFIDHLSSGWDDIIQGTKRPTWFG